MMNISTKGSLPPPRIEGISIENYRVLRDVELSPLTPLTTLLGPNGSGKSTVFDAFAFLSECFSAGCAKHGPARAIQRVRSRGSTGLLCLRFATVRSPKAPSLPII